MARPEATVPQVDMPAVEFEYINHRGIKAMRKVTPQSLFYGQTPMYASPTWLLLGWCHERQAQRHFALDGIITRGTREQMEGLQLKLDAARLDQHNLKALLAMITDGDSDDRLLLAVESVMRGEVLHWDGRECRHA